MLKKIVVSTILFVGLSINVQAESVDEWNNSHGLIGIEGSFGQSKSKLYETDPSTGLNRILQTKTDSTFGGGFKLGGQSENYRLFLSARYNSIPDYDYVVSYGLELQYLFPMSDTFNIFVGANTGVMSSQATVASIEYTANNPYGGADAGVNLELSEGIGFELGARIKKALASSDNEAYVDSIAEAYVSVIFKFSEGY